MPELPEVETVVRDLREKIVGDTIVDFWSAWPKAIKNQSLAKFKKEIVGKKIKGVRRIGKNIFVDLSGGKTLYLHLKMTGHLLIKTQNPRLDSWRRPLVDPRRANLKSQINSEFQNPKSKNSDYFADKVNQYIRHSWTLQTRKGGIKKMEFSDMRKFAKIVLADTDKIEELPEIKKLGIDAMDASLTIKKFEELLTRKKNKAVGLALMEQEWIAGIGNIYRSEILFVAGVLPERKCETLSMTEQKKIFQAMRSILKKAIHLRGTTDSDYRDTTGAPGGFQKVLQVYGKTGERCQKCAATIERGKMGQRSIFFCLSCQK